jgi:hypothetical protein
MSAIERATADAKLTAAPIKPGASGSILPEFGRVPDVERVFGIKRGTLYPLLSSGEIKSAVIRKQGAKTGIRLVHLASVREFLNRNLA